MKYLVLFMESEHALPIDMLSRPIHPDGKVRPQSQLATLLDRTPTVERDHIDTSAINGYTTLDVARHDDAVAMASSWNWCGKVELLAMDGAAISA